MQPKKMLFRIDLHKPEESIAVHLQNVDGILARIEQDDGKLMAFRYNNQDMAVMYHVMQRQAYTMLRPTKELTKAHLDTVDHYMSEKIGRERPEELQKLFAQGFEIIGYIDNRYSDLFGLVWSDEIFDTYQRVTLVNGQQGIAQRLVDGMTYMPYDDALAEEEQWLAADVQPLAQSKQPFIDMLTECKKELEERQQQDWSDVKKSAEIDDATKNQKRPGLN